MKLIIFNSSPEEMLEEFKTNTLNFLYSQEDLTDYEEEDISALINEIQNFPETDLLTCDKIYKRLSLNGKKIFIQVLEELKRMIK